MKKSEQKEGKGQCQLSSLQKSYNQGFVEVYVNFCVNWTYKLTNSYGSKNPCLLIEILFPVHFFSLLLFWVIWAKENAGSIKAKVWKAFYEPMVITTNIKYYDLFLRGFYDQDFGPLFYHKMVEKTLELYEVESKYMDHTVKDFIVTPKSYIFFLYTHNILVKIFTIWQRKLERNTYLFTC